jgi:hypothetical protein
MEEMQEVVGNNPCLVLHAIYSPSLDIKKAGPLSGPATRRSDEVNQG